MPLNVFRGTYHRSIYIHYITISFSFNFANIYIRLSRSYFDYLTEIFFNFFFFFSCLIFYFFTFFSIYFFFFFFFRFYIETDFTNARLRKKRRSRFDSKSDDWLIKHATKFLSVRSDSKVTRVKSF